MSLGTPARRWCQVFHYHIPAHWFSSYAFTNRLQACVVSAKVLSDRRRRIRPRQKDTGNSLVALVRLGKIRQRSRKGAALCAGNLGQPWMVVAQNLHILDEHWRPEVNLALQIGPCARQALPVVDESDVFTRGTGAQQGELRKDEVALQPFRFRCLPTGSQKTAPLPLL